jgi:hypothetical protein
VTDAEEPVFVDWMAADSQVAFGQLFGRPVAFVGDLGKGGAVVDGTSPLYDSPAFTPPLTNSDTAYMNARQDNEFTLLLGGVVRDLVMHLASFGSRLTFTSGQLPLRISGDESFAVDGPAVIGSTDGSTDANGTIQIPGLFSVLKFSLNYPGAGSGSPDGIYLQVGGFLPTSL